MIKFCFKPPAERFEILKKKASQLCITQNKTMTNFNIVIDEDFSNCEGRILKPPTVFYKNIKINPEKGSWNLRGAAAINPVTIKSWIVMTMFKTDHQIVRKNIDVLINHGEKFGMKFNAKYVIKEILSPSKYFETLESQNFDLVIVILKSKSSMIYGNIKKTAETEGKGVITQCLLFSNLKNLVKASFSGNVLIKINSKLGGKSSRINFNTKLLEKSTIVFGGDLSYGGMNSPCDKSLVAIVASMDKDLITYSTSLRAQAKGQEIIENLEIAAKEMIMKFSRANNKCQKI